MVRKKPYQKNTGDGSKNDPGTPLDYRQFFDHLDDLMVLLDADVFPPVVLDMNRPAREMYVPAGQKAEGQPFTELFHGEGQRLLEDHLQKVRQKEEVVFEMPHPRNRGWLQVTLRLIQQQEKQVILCLQRDITEKKEMLSSASADSEKYEDIYEHAATGLFESTLDGSRFISFNESFRKITGYSAAELRHIAPGDLWYIPEERDFFVKALRNKGWVEGYASRLRTARGRLSYVILSARLNRKKNTITGSMMDVTQRYRDELLRNVIYNISDAAFTAGSLHELLITINLELTRLIKSKNLLIGLVNEKTGMLTLPYMRDEKKVIRSFPLKLTISRLVIENDEPLFLKKPELERLTREGRINTARTLPEVWLGVPLHDNNRTFGILALQDYHNADAFTEEDFKLLTYVGNQISMSLSRKQTEEEVRRLKMGFEQSPISVVITDPEGYIEYVNPFFENLTGYSFNEVKGKNPRILKSGQTPQETYDELWSTVTKNKVWTGEFLNKKKNGELYWESAVISPIFDGRGKLMNYIGLKEDITLRKKYESGLKKALVRAEESDKLKTAFLATISHELRTPLNAIIGFSEMLMEEHVDTMTGRFSENIYHSGQELLKIIEDILNLSLIESKTLKFSHEEVPLILLENLVEDEFIQKNRKYKKSELTWSVGMAEPLREMSLHTDRKYLVYVISLIIDNALKFTDKGNIEVRMEDRGTELFIHVEDTGPGIEARHRQVIFNKFRQLEDPFTRRFGGTGIGLTIAVEVVRLMGGDIDVESEPGKGSLFTIRVPGLVKNEAMPAESPPTDARQILEGRKVLVVDDEELNYLLLKEILKSREAELLWAQNGREALALAKEHPGIFLTLMDIRMPVMNGLEATRILKTNNPALPVIALTAYNMQEDKEKAFEAGCDAFLTKPVNKEILFSTIMKVVTAG